jgi:hypothetical protein
MKKGIKTITIKELIDWVKERNIPDDTELFVEYYKEKPVLNIGHSILTTELLKIKQHKLLLSLKKN